MSRNIQFIPINRFLQVVGVFTWLYLFPVYLKELGASEYAVGLAYSLFNIGITLFQFPGGYMADIYKKKTLLIIMQSLMPIIFVLMGMMRSYIPLVALYLIYCVLSSLTFPVVSGLLANTIDKKDMGKAFSILQAYFIMGFGMGPMLGYFLLSKGFQVHELFYVTAVFSFLSFLITLFYVVEEAYPLERKIDRSWRFKMTGTLKGIFIIGSFFFILMQYTLYSPLPPIFMEEILGYIDTKINLVFAMGGFLAGLVAMGLGRFLNSKTSPYFYFIAQVMHFALVYFWIITGSPYLFIPGWAMIQLSLSSLQVMLADASHSGNRGKVFGLFGTVTGLIPAFVPVLLLFLKNHFGYSVVYLTVFPLIIAQYMVFRKFRKTS